MVNSPKTAHWSNPAWTGNTHECRAIRQPDVCISNPHGLRRLYVGQSSPVGAGGSQRVRESRPIHDPYGAQTRDTLEREIGEDGTLRLADHANPPSSLKHDNRADRRLAGQPPTITIKGRRREFS